MFDGVRHFALLVGLAAALVLAGAPRGATAPQFALYGALHAAALACSVRARPSIARGLLFSAAAALLSVLVAWLGLLTLRAALAPVAAVVFGAGALGALAYGGLIRRCLAPRLGARLLPAIALGAAGAALGAFELCRRVHAASGLWLALAWWFALSAGLWWACAGIGARAAGGAPQGPGLA